VRQSALNSSRFAHSRGAAQPTTPRIGDDGAVITDLDVVNEAL
jgi:hypothetical protein